MGKVVNSEITLTRLFNLLHTYKENIVSIYIYAVLNGLIVLSLPLGVQAIIGLITSQQLSTSWLVLIVIISVGMLISGIFQIYQTKILEYIQQSIFVRAAFDFAYRIPKFKFEKLTKYHPPELINRFFDAILIQKGVNKIILDFATSSLQILFGLLLISFYHYLFVFFGFILILSLIVIFKLTFKPGLATSLEESNHKYEVAHWLEELARTMGTFKLYPQENLSIPNTNANLEKYISARQSHFKVILIQLWSNVVFKLLMTILLLVLGSTLVVNGEINIGQFVAAEIILISIINSVEKFILSMSEIFDTLTALEKVGYVTDIELEKNNSDNIQNINKEGLKVEILNLSYRYSETEDAIIKDINVTINPGEKLAIFGRSGSGKTTLIRLISGFYDDMEGNIIFNNISVRNFHKDVLRMYIGDNFGEQNVFHGTIMENLTLGNPNIELDNLFEILENLKMKDKIDSLKDGLNTVIQAEGKNFSRTFLRKIVIARSLLKRPQLLLLDDFGVYFDKIQRKQIIDYLFSLKNVTLIYCTDDDYLLNHSDKILYLDKGVCAGVYSYNEIISTQMAELINK